MKFYQDEAPLLPRFKGRLARSESELRSKLAQIVDDPAFDLSDEYETAVEMAERIGQDGTIARDDFRQAIIEVTAAFLWDHMAGPYSRSPNCLRSAGVRSPR